MFGSEWKKKYEDVQKHIEQSNDSLVSTKESLTKIQLELKDSEMREREWRRKYEDAYQALSRSTESLLSTQKNLKKSQSISEEWKLKCEDQEQEIVMLKEVQADYDSLIKEMKFKLDIAQKFETAHRIDQYLANASTLFKFTNLIEYITQKSDISSLLQLHNENNLAFATEYMPEDKKNNSVTELELYRSKLQKELDDGQQKMLEMVAKQRRAAQFNDGNLENYFKLSKQSCGGYHVEQYIGFDDELLVIPERYMGEPILSVRERLCYNCKSLKTLIIEAPIQQIPKSFCENSGVERVVLHASTQSIAEKAFERSPLAEIILGDCLTTIGTSAFHLTRLTTINFPDSLQEIGPYAFCETNLTTVICPKRLKNIKDHAFSDCSNLTKVILNNRLKEIGKGAFSSTQIILSKNRKINGIQEVVIPSRVNIIDGGVGYPPFEKNVVLKCYPGSYAQEWAREYNFTIKNANEEASETVPD